MMKIAIFASGNGSNMENIATYIANSTDGAGVEIGCVVYDRADAYVRQRAERLGVPAYYISAEGWRDGAELLSLLRQHEVVAIVLAGFLRLIPGYLLEAFPQRIVNIHPALLPKYGGRGMYGHHVHEAVHAAGERETGITIHVIDEEYDRGTVLLQATTPIEPTDTPDLIAERVHALEYEYFPSTIVRWLRGELPAR